MSGDRTLLITGATDGLGRRVAERLAGPGVHLLVHGRDAARGRALVEAVERAGGAATFYAADLASLSAVRQMAEAILARHVQLDGLLNNAGIAKLGDRRRVSADGFELHFAVNYLAPFLLTQRLRALLGARAPSRVVNVASAGQSPIEFDDVMLEYHYDGYRAYGQSKLAEVMFTFDLADELKASGVTVDCLHPGTYLDTAMVRDAGIRPVTPLESGADAVLALLADPGGGTGRYFEGHREARASAQAYDLPARRRLKALSRQLTGLPS